MTHGPLIDIPVVRAIVAHHGRERGLGIIAALADPADHEAATAAFEALGSKIERSDPEYGPETIESVFALHEAIDPETGGTDYDRTVFWDNGGIVMHGRTLPETTAISLAGRPVDMVLTHPCVAGLTIATVDPTPSEDKPLVVVDLAGHTCALADAANHLGGV